MIKCELEFRIYLLWIPSLDFMHVYPSGFHVCPLDSILNFHLYDTYIRSILLCTILLSNPVLNKTCWYSNEIVVTSHTRLQRESSFGIELGG